MKANIWIALLAMVLGLPGLCGAESGESPSAPTEQSPEPRNCEDFMESPGFVGIEATIQQKDQLGNITNSGLRFGAFGNKSGIGGQCISTKKAVDRAFEQRGQDAEGQQQNQ